MKLFVALFVALNVFIFAAAENPVCSINIPLSETLKAVKLQSACNTAMIDQIKREMGASYMYFQMGAYFEKDDVNRPGIAKTFFNAAKEERDHSIALMNYLSMRLADETDISKLESIFAEFKQLENRKLSGKDAFKKAYEMEQHITKEIKNVINSCKEDDHLTDYLTGEFLTEQHESERFYAGKFAALDRMVANQGSLGEYLFDKTL